MRHLLLASLIILVSCSTMPKGWDGLRTEAVKNFPVIVLDQPTTELVEVGYSTFKTSAGMATDKRIVAAVRAMQKYAKQGNILLPRVDGYSDAEIYTGLLYQRMK